MQAIPASAATMFTIAISLTVSTRSKLWLVAMSRKVWLYWLITLAFQNSAVAVCAAVRAVLVAPPIFSVSFRSVAYSGLVIAGGAGARNWSGVSSMNGFTFASHGVWADCADGGGANTQVPGAWGATPDAVETGASRPSPNRLTINWLAAAEPTATPASLAFSGTCASVTFR